MKALIVYYSHSGNTRRLAEAVARETGGDLIELVPQTPYPRDYDTVVAQARQEIRAGFRPALRSAMPDMSRYDIVLIGTPNWWSTMAPPVAAFLEKADFSGKQAALFCTHGGGGAGHIRQDVKRLSGLSIVSELSVYGDTGRQADIQGWLRPLGLLK